MKQTLLSFAAIVCIGTSTFATTHTITAAGTAFSPASGITVNMGDTVKWVWGSGSHTTTSTTIPSGAATWSNDLNSGSTSFIYVPTVAGTYNYQCNIHFSMGMVGSFEVIGSAGVAQTSAPKPLFQLFPNPAAESLHLVFNEQAQHASVRLTDMIGKLVFENSQTATTADIDLKNIPGGLYVITAVQGGREYKQQVQVTH